MASLFTPVRAVLALAVALPLGGCVIEDDHHHYHDRDGYGYGGTAPTPVPSTSGTTTPSTPPSPLLVEVDTDQTMSADPGGGVGVFVEYAKGGYWHVWWTCDTNITSQQCTYAVNLSVATGSITNVDSGDIANFVTAPTANRLEARTTTTTQTHGIYFNSDPGAVLTVDASLDGLQDGSFLFFVQNGKVNGDYKGTLTNPLQFQGNTP